MRMISFKKVSWSLFVANFNFQLYPNGTTVRLVYGRRGDARRTPGFFLIHSQKQINTISRLLKLVKENQHT